MTPLSIDSFLKPSALTIARRAAAPVSRAELEARIAAWQAALAAQPGRQFALYLDDGVEFSAALLAGWLAGKTIWLCADTLESSIVALRDQVDGFIGQFPTCCQPLPVPDFAAAGSTTELLAVPLDPDFVGLVVHTSGSTGTAQAIPKKLKQLASEIATLENVFAARIGDAEIVATVSHHHIYGLLFKLLWPLFSGRVFHAVTLDYPEQIAQRLANGPCALISSPAHLKRLPDQLDWTPAIAIFCSGGVLPTEVGNCCAQLLGSVPVEVYGSSETGGIAWRQRAHCNDEAWNAMPDVAWQCNASDQTIAIRSPHLFTDDWLTLSDRIAPTGDGRFTLIGRSDRIVKIEEKRISLDAVERHLLLSPLVAEVKLLVPKVDAAERQYLAAAVLLTAQGRANLQQHGKLELNRRLRAQLQGVVDPLAMPRRWRYLDSFPVNPQGKTTLALLQALFDPAPAAAPIAPQITLRQSDLQQHENRQHQHYQAEFEVRWPRDLHYFVGHFPEAPVLPGVAQVHWAIQIARGIFAMPGAFHAMHALKFQQVVFPDEVTLLKLSYDPNKRSLSFAYSSVGKQHSSGKIVFHD